ncbi:LuxR family transcriptional regulator [Virgisporangium ochraceum]|uniref:Transcriptional regulator n=1 Tax=Virgisporangium ochraceum TaxID=65505 RepID=A0A8J3ZZH5_9ACTN|nr:LuxR family transcriptional regulator [Virgisporangium ochraceum]GIJ71355.1 transcriptional regulator [Virgisporangium ochraceum]
MAAISDDASFPARQRARALLGREAECEALDRLLSAVRGGQGRSLVIHGEPGIGKSVLLDYLIRQAGDCRVVSAVGIPSEAELAYAALHHVCAPLLSRLGELPEPQRDAVGTAFGLRGGPPPDRFLVGLGVLGLFALAAESRPLLCVIDDLQWLDEASAQSLAFLARRLGAEPVACVFAVRDAEDSSEGGPRSVDDASLPRMRVRGLSDGDARTLLGTALLGPMDDQVRDRIVAEARGNPLALIELPRGLTNVELAGGYGFPVGQALTLRIEQSFLRRLGQMPPDARRLLLVAAAELHGDPIVVWRAAARLSIDVGAAAAAAASGLIEFGTRIRFCHPLVRSAVYRSAPARTRMSVHAALAESLDGDVHTERRAWHRAHATTAPDEALAEDLERSAARAQARGGLAAAAAFLHRAVMFTPDPEDRARRALDAASAHHDAGSAGPAQELLETARRGARDASVLARISLLHAEIAFTTSRGVQAPPLLLDAARQLAAFDVTLARQTYLQAVSAAMFTGRLAAGDGVTQIARAARAAPPSPAVPAATDLLLDGFTLLLTENADVATPSMRTALHRFREGMVSPEDQLRWSWLAFVLAMACWDDDTLRTLAERHVNLARRAGALAVLPLALSSRILLHLFEGELDAAAALVDEVTTITTATGMRITDYGTLALAAWQGREEDAEQIGAAAILEATARGEGVGLTNVQWTRAVLYNGLGRYTDARDAAIAACSDGPVPGAAAQWAPVELVEAAVRCGDTTLAARALEQLLQSTHASQSAWARGMEARSRALLASGEQADDLYREAIERLHGTRLRSEVARAHLVYGEWLRRERRRLEARQHLSRAHDMFDAIGMGAFASRAAGELRATGKNARRRSVETTGDLTPRELQIARLAREGLSNPEIATRLFMSPRTVEYHLHKVFAKRGITSRVELRAALADDIRTPGFGG